jgi:hypothetical protein
MQSPVFLALLFFSLSAMLVSSCKKEKQPAIATPGIYMKLDSLYRAFPDNDRATRNELAGVYTLTIAAAEEPREISITLYSNKWNFDSGKEYHFTVPELPGVTNSILYCPDAPVYYDCAESVPPSWQKPQLTVNITESNTEYVKGTFSGFIFLKSLTGTRKKSTITEGRFYVRFPH